MKLKRCVIVVENLPVPLDRHVWQQAQALRDAGWRVSVICPTGPSAQAIRETLDGIEIYRHPLITEGRSFWGHVLEYASASFHEARLLLRLAVSGGFDVIHACNPPDFLFLLALPYKIFGVKFVFDHHDLAPELFETLYGGGFVHRLLLRLERWSFEAADVVLSSNETFRELAIARGGRAVEDVFVVHTIPDAAHLRLTAPDTTARAGQRLVLGYLGIIGQQDGVDHLLEAARILRFEYGLTDFQVVIVGDGPALPGLRELASRLQLSSFVTFRGYLLGEALAAQVSDFDIGVIPDPRNPFNDKLSMNKVFEYSALGIPIACYSLRENVRLLADAGTYAEGDRPTDLAAALATLMADDELRQTKAAQSKQAARDKFDWARESASLLAAYDQLMEPTKRFSGRPVRAGP
jgi:glycosyltransferase involved in cell wall biosynthesis